MLHTFNAGTDEDGFDLEYGIKFKGPIVEK
jgi:hypothetical protein